MITERVVAWAAEECSWQQSGELSVAWMVAGWRYANRRRSKPVLLGHVLGLGRIVEPRTNQYGLSRVGVRVGWDVKMDPAGVPETLAKLVINQPPIGYADDAITDWFWQYEEIHPFRDGNGRTGSILFNWLSGTLSAPCHPPNLWDDPRRDYDGYPIPGKLARP